MEDNSMKNMGVSFKIPNEYGSYLAEILEPIPFGEYQWLIDNDEIHLLKDNKFTNKFLFNKDKIIHGDKLYNIAKINIYYMVFVTLRAFLKEGTVQAISSYKGFLDSDCQIALVVYDCSYVMFWSKDNQLTLKMYRYALSKGYENIKYISEEDLLKNKYYIE